VLLLIGMMAWSTQAKGGPNQTEIYFDKVHIIPHSHWDVGWLKTKENYFNTEVKMIINSVLNSLAKDPKRKFIFVEISFINEWWDQAPEDLQKQFVKFLNEKRIEFALGGMTMSDEAANTYVSVIHTLTRGHQYIKDVFDTKIVNKNDKTFVPKSSFRIDPFGSTTTMSRLYKESGLTDTVIMRIPYNVQEQMRKDKKMAFMWKLSDESTMYSNIMDYQYCVRSLFFDGESSFSYGDEANAADILHSEIMKYSLGFDQNEIMLPAGCDFTFYDASTRFDKIERAMNYINAHPEKYPYKVQFSLLSEYMDASRPKTPADEKKLPQIDADFMPYADGLHAYWTGYYTSYPALKQSIRLSEGFFRTAKTLFALSVPFMRTTQDRKNYLTQGFESLDTLAVAMADVTHHDAITGTSVNEVSEDYVNSMKDGIANSKKILKDALTVLLTDNIPKGDIQSEQYRDLISTSLSFADLFKNFSTLVSNRLDDFSIPVVVYNNLGWEMENQPVFINLSPEDDFTITSQACFFDSQGKRLRTQPVVLRPDENEELSVLVPKIPALGYTTIFMKRCGSYFPQVEYKEEKVEVTESKPYVVSNRKTSLTFCNRKVESGSIVSLCQVKKGDKTYELNQSLMAYQSYSSYGGQASGAYIFRPDDLAKNLKQSGNTLTTSYITENRLFTQVAQDVTSYAKQYVRLYAPEVSAYQGYDFEYIFVVGPLPVDSELITLFNASSFINSNGAFYCDKNGLETTKAQSDPNPAKSYRPMVYNCFIRDEEKKTQMTLFISETHGATSLNNGELEIMLHRRTSRDDGRGVNQAVDDETVVLISVKVRIDEDTPVPDLKTISFPKQTLSFNFPPFLFPFNKTYHTPRDSSSINVESFSKFKKDYSALSKPLPDNVHLLNLDIVLNRETGSGDDVKTILQFQNLGKEPTSVNSASSLLRNGIVDRRFKMNETNLSTGILLNNVGLSESIALDKYSFKTLTFIPGEVAEKKVFKEQDHSLEWTFSVGLFIATISMLVLLSTTVVYFIYIQAIHAYSMVEQKA